MTTNVIPMFAYGDRKLRATMIDGEPWFSAQDACDILGLVGFASSHLKPLAADEKRVVQLSRETSLRHLARPKAPNVSLISRPGLFKLIQRSNKPEAKKFDRWVRHEVLPQIMDNGGYVMADADMEKVAGAAEANGPRNLRGSLPALGSYIRPVARSAFGTDDFAATAIFLARTFPSSSVFPGNFSPAGSYHRRGGSMRLSATY